jgi:hypothetical protein
VRAVVSLRLTCARRRPDAKILGRLVLGRLAHGNLVHHFDGAATLGQPRRRAFVLQHVGLAFDGGDSALYMNLEMVR